LLLSCKADYKDKIWSNSYSFFQITDSLVYFSNPSSNDKIIDYFYEIKDDSIFLNNGLCRLQSLSYKIEVSKNSLILTGFQNNYNKWLYDKGSLAYKIDTLSFSLAENQNDTISKIWTIQKVLHNSFDCEIQGSWYDSLTNQILVFDSKNCYKANKEQATLLSFTKNNYKCYQNNSFILRSLYCQSQFFDMESIDDYLMKWNTDYINGDSYIYRIKDIEIDTTDYSNSNFTSGFYDLDSIDITPISFK
jgi:hypothetical protein